MGKYLKPFCSKTLQMSQQREFTLSCDDNVPAILGGSSYPALHCTSVIVVMRINGWNMQCRPQAPSPCWGGRAATLWQPACSPPEEGEATIQLSLQLIFSFTTPSYSFGLVSSFGQQIRLFMTRSESSPEWFWTESWLNYRISMTFGICLCIIGNDYW